MSKTSTIILRVDEDTRGYVEKRANKRGIGLSECVREMIETYRSLKWIEGEVEDIRKFLKDLEEKIVFGEIEIEDGVLRGFSSS